MRAIGVASAALLGVTALTLTAPTATAGEEERDITPFGFSVQPSTVAAGGQVTLLLRRDGGCKGNATVSSGVFDTVTIPHRQSSATATVDRDAKPGAVYQVTFTCDGVSGHTDLGIAAGHPDGPSRPLAPVHQGVKAGIGGSVAGFDVQQIGLGAALIAGSVGAAWYVSRRRATGDS
ncbi:hypothetical protein ACFYP4_11335 [Streptomyces sp. NPDC005551]|uniref:hypothetical protein n=1 Tax=unclassified Streptomyces TaxID=2593676 RepID=UPI0034118DD1